MVGFRTTKACASAKNIRSIQIIYISNSTEVCDNSLEEVNQTVTEQDLCPDEETLYSVESVLEMTGWTEQELKEGGRQSGSRRYRRRGSSSFPTLVAAFILTVLFSVSALILTCYIINRKRP
jgi:hypothetical protein